MRNSFRFTFIASIFILCLYVISFVVVFQEDFIAKTNRIQSVLADYSSKNSSSSGNSAVDSHQHGDILGQIESTDAILDSDKNATSTSTTSPFPLKPPFRIVQWGIPRTGSTFQTHLLHAIVSLKAPNSSKIQFLSGKMKYRGKSSFVFKTHMPDDTLIQMAEQNTISTFTSSDLGGTSYPHIREAMNNFSYPILYTQMKENLLNCSLCEVDQYAKIFDLTNKEVRDIKQYMKYYEIIRRCCGYQMSKYEMKRLNGCNMTKYRSQPDYPNCEAYNKSEIEILLANNPGGIKHHSMHPKFNWVEVGDCQRMDESIATGLGFNRKKFEGCDDD